MSKHYVFSTLTNNQKYQNYSVPPHGGQPTPTESVMIRGGANVAPQNLITPKGVMTVIDDKQYEILKRNFVFNQHVKSGHIVVRDSKIDPDLAAKKDMAPEDDSAPLTPKKLQELNIAAKVSDGKPVTTNKMRGMVA